MSNKSCAEHLAKQRWPDGFVCPRCGHQHYWYLSKRNLYDCKNCRYQTSITAGTLFHHTHVPLVDWYRMIYTMALKKQGVSIHYMQEYLGIGCYETAWKMAHKIRNAMSDRDERFKLAGLVKINVSYFRAENAKPSPGRKSRKTLLCAVAIYRNYKDEDEPGFAQMKIVNDVSTKTIESFLEEIDRRNNSTEVRKLLTKINNDGWKTFPLDDDTENLSNCEIVISDHDWVNKLKIWINHIICDSKDVIIEKHHGVSEKYLATYLSEIVYRFNYQHWEHELFDRLIQSFLKAV